MPFQTERCSHVTREAIPLGPQVLRTVRNAQSSFYVNSKKLTHGIEWVQVRHREAPTSKNDEKVCLGGEESS